MKEFHPTAHIVDLNGQVSGMIIHSGGLKRPRRGTIAKAVNMVQFTELVKDNKVQLFQLKALMAQENTPNNNFWQTN